MQKLIHKQKGVALIIFAIILVLAAMAYLIKMFDPVALQAARDDKNTQFLAQAKRALISYSITRAAVGERPGDMPIPDYFAVTESPANYDGTADTGCIDSSNPLTGLPLIATSSFISGVLTPRATARCLGRLPWRTVGLSISDSSENDSAGTMPWYAVSANLVDPSCAKFINPKLVNLPYVGTCLSDVALSHRWLTVRDSSGNILSSQVAAVLMLPSGILSGQTRPTTPLAGVTNYLDSVTVPVGCAAPCIPGTYSNADFDNDFIVPPSPNVPSAPNDQVVYITIQELMSAVERRATQEAAAQLKRYYTNSNANAANRFYPYAANLGDTSNACVEGSSAGLLPLSAICKSNSDCVSSFIKTPSIQFTRVCSGNYTASTGACTFSGTTCTCTGAGSCTRNPTSINNSCLSTTNLRRLTCDTSGHCVSNVIGQFTYTYTPPIPDNTVVGGACTATALNTITCTGPGNFSVTNCSHPNKLLATMPAWFIDNQWQDYIYYAVSNNCSAASTGCAAANLRVGAHNNVHALVIAPGITLPVTEVLAAPQVRPSGNITDYLDSLVNTDGGTPTDPTNIIFDATSKMKSIDYNDQPLIVAP